MAITRIAALQRKWSSDVPLQAAVNAAFDRIGFTEEYVEDCIATADGGNAPNKTKFIKDNIWGMIRASAHTMRLLDCPVVQRLRGIKQLGLSYLTYPTAEHTRFVHSLGVSYVVGRFLEAIEQRAQDKATPGESLHYVGLPQLGSLKSDDIIHAALLHDVGHMPFSHASEAVFKGRETLFTCGKVTVADFFGDVEIELKKNIQLSEALSILIVLSIRFSRFYLKFVRPGLEDPEVLLRIACLICGLPPEPLLSGVTDLISAAAVDADKVDYINRDARACGIPVGLDVSRIFLRSGFIRASRDAMIKAQLKEDPAEEEILFVVNASGMDTLDEIMLARAALYQRVYLHAVTRTAETVLAKVLELNAQSSNKIPELADALGLWSTCDEALLDKVSNSSDLNVKRLGQKLKNRWLPKKALAFGASSAKMFMPLRDIFPNLRPTDIGIIEAQIANTLLENLTQKNMAAGLGAQLESDIRNELDALLVKIPALRRSKPLEILAIIGSAYMEQPRRDCVVLFNGDLVHTTKLTTSKEQQDAFDIYKAVGYIMCDYDWRSLVMIAARSVLCRTASTPIPYRLAFGQAVGETASVSALSVDVHIMHRTLLDSEQVIRHTGLNKQSVASAVRAAVDAGYFDDKPHLGPSEDAGSARIRSIAKRLEGFEGEHLWRVRPRTVAQFLCQFPQRLRGEMTSMLEKIVFFDSQQLVQLLFEPLLELGEAEVVPLSPNSGSDVRMKLERAAKGKDQYEKLTFINEIHATLSKDTMVPLALVDDNISTATQAQAQFLSWCGVPEERWPLECQGEDGIFPTPLKQEALARLKTRPLKIIVAAGRAEADLKLKEKLTELGFTGFLGVGYKHRIDGVEWSPELKQFLTEVGVSLLAWTKYRKRTDELSPEERNHCDSRAFGYRNVGGLLATATNVPTATVTALWSPGLYRNDPWMPLLIRQHKLRHLIVA